MGLLPTQPAEKGNPYSTIQTFKFADRSQAFSNVFSKASAQGKAWGSIAKGLGGTLNGVLDSDTSSGGGTDDRDPIDKKSWASTGQNGQAFG